MSMRWLRWGLLAAAAAAFGCAATRPAANAPVAAGANFDSLPAPDAYQKLCAHCHGPEATGYAADHAPSLVNPTFLESASDSYLHGSIAQGRPGTSMGAYARSVGGPLEPGSIDRLIAWLRTHGPPAKDLAPVAPGDSVRGRPIYVSHCQSCHGDLERRGPEVMLANAGFLAVASDAFIQHAIVEGRPGTSMVSFRDSLGTSDIADVVAYLRSLARPFNANRLPAPTGKEPLFAYPHGKAPDFASKPDRFVGVDQVAQALQQHRKLVIIDARPESEWSTTHIASAVSIPYYQLKRLDEIPKDACAIAYCACPHHLSGIVVDSLRARGNPHSFVLDEGVLEWERRGYPIVAAPGVALPPLEAQSPGASNR